MPDIFRFARPLEDYPERKEWHRELCMVPDCL